jgi:micrococcal nuclease
MFEYNARVTRVVDGDTLDLEVDLGFSVFHRVRVRLAGVDTPETFGVKHDSPEYAAGVQARTFVEDFVAMNDGRVTVVTLKDKKGKFGRYLATIHAGDVATSLNDLLIEKGLAEKYGE